MNKKLIGLLIIFLSIQSFAQRSNSSPYSFFGIGDESDQKTVEEISMGKIGTAFNSSYQLTFSNPAALAHLRVTTFMLAGENKLLMVNDGTNTESASAASLSYMAIGIPIGNKAGFSFGLQPNTTVGYSLLQELSNGSNLFSGDGGTNRVFLGFGYKLPKNISIGLEAAYIFGNIENMLLNRQDDVQFATMHKTDAEITGFTAKVGIQYNKKINDKLTLKAGGVVNLKNDLSNEGNEYLFSLDNIGGGIVRPRDTIINNSFTNTVKTPLKTTLSVGLGQENKWYAGVEYSFQGALEIANDVLGQSTITSFDNSNRVSIGGLFTPKFNSITNYWQRVTYRAGVNFKQTGLVINSTAINDFGISFGVGLPVGQQLSNLNLGFEFGKRGEISNGLIKENYLNFRLSLTLNDRWFRKRNIN